MGLSELRYTAIRKGSGKCSSGPDHLGESQERGKHRPLKASENPKSKRGETLPGQTKMIEAKNIITLAPPLTPINDVRIVDLVNVAQGGYRLRYRPVASVMYLLGGAEHYPWETDMIVVEKRYGFKDRTNLSLDFYWPEKDHGNTKQGRCECGYPTCTHLGLWEGTESAIIGGDDFGEVLAKRLEYLVKVENRNVTAKAKRLAKIAADPAAHEAKKIKAKEKRDAKKAAAPVLRSSNGPITPESLGVTEIH